MISTFFGGNEQIGINKTVNWQWDISSWIFYTKWSWSIFILGYGIVELLKYYTHKELSFLHLFLIILIFLAEDFMGEHYPLILFLNFVSMLVFLINLIWTIRNRNKRGQKKPIRNNG